MRISAAAASWATPWHDAGKMSCKRNTFTDFIAVTEQLVRAGAMATPRARRHRRRQRRRPADGRGRQHAAREALFRVVLSHVPFVDVMNTMLDASLPLTVAEYEEWGNPNEPEAFAYMLSYSPYDNLDAAAAVPGDAGQDQPERLAGDVLGARQVRREAAHPQDRTTRRCCCTSTWKPATAALPAATTT